MTDEKRKPIESAEEVRRREKSIHNGVTLHSASESESNRQSICAGSLSRIRGRVSHEKAQRHHATNAESFGTTLASP
jgi:hypothetical protein